MNKIKKLFLVTLSTVLLSGVFGFSVLAGPDGRQQDPGGGGSNPNVNRSIRNGGGTASNRPWGESTLTVARASQVRLVTTGASITGGGHASNTNSTNGNSLNVGDYARTTRLTANSHTNVTYQATFAWTAIGQTNLRLLGGMSRHW